MCGIAGLVRFDGLHTHEGTLGARMAATLRHRGPDQAGHYHDRWASLGHARLSIIDLAAGSQPMGNEDDTIQVCYNGEIYNHAELAERLRQRGHRLNTRCDTEIIPHLYEEYGEAFAEHLNGMFAIALWDAKRRKLVLIRDRLGIKPLYWSDDGRRVLFGSELKALVAAYHNRPQIDPCALKDYLTFGHVPAPRTIYQGIHKLEPGCLAVCQAGGTAVRRWWDIPFTDDVRPQSEHAWLEEFRGLLEDAIGQRMIADVPLGAFLSGGIDSTTIVAGMRRRHDGPVLTQTVGFDERGHDERGPARQVADRLGTRHHEIMVRPDAAWAAQRLANHYDEPFADSSAVPTFYLSQAARQQVTVALAGDGADEMLAGYRRYRFDLLEHSIRNKIPAAMRSALLGTAGGLYPKADWLPRPLRAKATLRNLACDDATGHLRSVSLFGGLLPKMLLRLETAALVDHYDPYARGRSLYHHCPSSDALNRYLYMDMKTLLPDDMLTKVDRASMAVGLEVRVPLLDHRVVACAVRMPSQLKLKGRTGKYILRRLLTNWLGAEIAERPKKGFDVPVDQWFRGPLREMAGDLLLAPGTQCRQWIEPQAIQQAMQLHQNGRRHNGHLLWTLLSLELWADKLKNHRPLDMDATIDMKVNQKVMQTEADPVCAC